MSTCKRYGPKRKRMPVERAQRFQSNCPQIAVALGNGLQSWPLRRKCRVDREPGSRPVGVSILFERDFSAN